jgi:glycosyltransferase involved in cell wall biosynthesis
MRDPSSSKKTTVEILTHLDTSGNPRVLKEASALAASGYRVKVVTSVLPKRQNEATDPASPFEIKRLNQRPPFAAVWWNRVFKRLARFQLSLARFPLAVYGSLFADLKDYLRKPSRSPVIQIIHLEPALLAKSSVGGADFTFGDFEDWYSEDLLPGDRPAPLTQLIQDAESHALNEFLSCWCTSKCMAHELTEARSGKTPMVIRNAFPAKDRDLLDGEWQDRSGMARWMPTNDPKVDRPKEAPVSIHWFSQTIGPGRGIEELLRAASGLEGEFELHLRGDLRGYGRWLESCTPGILHGRVHLHSPVAPHELLSRICEHDIGYCGEPTVPRNKNLTISNKFFQYLQGGLAVIATATAGQREGAREAGGAVSLVRPRDPEELRLKLQALIHDRNKLATMRSAAWEAGERLCWENEAPKLIRAVEQAMGKFPQR